MSNPENANPYATVRLKAEAGDAEAQYELAWRHALGNGLPLDDEAAVRWLQSAAEKGHPLARNNLGARHVSGDGVPRDLVEAYRWFHLAAAAGDRKAGKNRDSIALEMTPDQLAEARRRAGA
jgi:TPR repeat protein